MMANGGSSSPDGEAIARLSSALPTAHWSCSPALDGRPNNQQAAGNTRLGWLLSGPHTDGSSCAACFLQQGGARTAPASVLPCLPQSNSGHGSQSSASKDRFGPHMARSFIIPAIEESCSPPANLNPHERQGACLPPVLLARYVL